MEIGYLKSAIKLSAVDYIEKPIKLQDLEHAVRKTVDFIRENREQSFLFDEIMDLQRQKLANMLKQPGAQMKEPIQMCKEVEFPADSKYVSIVAWLMPGAKARENSVSAIYEYWKSNGTPSVYCHLDGTKYLFTLALRNKVQDKFPT
jgi:two-component system response regulator YesN